MSGKNRLTSVARVAALSVLLVGTGLVLLFPRQFMDLALPDQTVYAPGFSEEKFEAVRTGMSQEQVLELLGQPLRVSEYVGARVYDSGWTSGPSDVQGMQYSWWAYAKPGCLTGSYHVRAIKFSPERLVLEVDRTQYVD